MIPETVESKLDTLPASPGVYVFRGHRQGDAPGPVLYVGKAASLRSRVRSYFQASSSDGRFFIALLDRELGDIETYVVKTEKEAALLENQLIKELQPRFNVKLRDDKEFLSLRLSPRAQWPRLEVVRKPRPDGARYFGPYHSASSARQTLRLVNRHFQLRTCTDAELKSRTRPCLQYQIKRCPAPCVYAVSPKDYGEQVELVSMFLDGRHDALVRELQAKMGECAKSMAYEQAAVYRDQLRAVERVREEQHVASVTHLDQDVLGLFRQADQAQVAVLRARAGKLVGVDTFDLNDVALPDDELLASFAAEFYARSNYVPHEVLLPFKIEMMEALEAVLSDQRGTRCRMVVPQRGSRVRLVTMAQENAEHAFKERARADENVQLRLQKVQERLRLPRTPRRIECIDISHTGGEDTVAAIVALLDGAPDRARYRNYRIRRVRGGDDYGAMHEALSRRIKRGKDNPEQWGLPDLLVVDGGKGQLNVALTVLRDLEITDLPVVGLAKEKETALGEKVVDRVYLPGAKNAIALRESHPALQMLALARDEAHRVSNLHRQKLGKQSRIKSALENVPGIGPKTKTRLLKTFGSVDGVLGARDEQLKEAGLHRGQIEALRKTLTETRTTATEADDAVDARPATEATEGDDAENAEILALRSAFAALEPDDG